MPYPRVLNPLGFIFANLIIYWGGFESMWKLLTGIFVGRVLFEIMLRRHNDVRRSDIDWRAVADVPQRGPSAQQVGGCVHDEGQLGLEGLFGRLQAEYEHRWVRLRPRP